MKSDFETTIEYAPTKDGWNLAFVRHKPLDFNKKKAPVLLCHGFASNRYDLDFGESEKYSLAKYLAKRGFDTWVLELRGRGRSKKEGKEFFDWNFDTYVNYDTPAAVGYILRKYKVEYGVNTKILWVGHSMGGMISYVYGSREGKRNLKSVVTIASPIYLTGLLKNLEKDNLKWLIRLVDILCPPRVNKPFLLPLWLENKWIRNLVEKYFVNKDNVNLDILNKMWENGIEVVSCKVLYQFAFMLSRSDFCMYPKYPRICKKFENTILQNLFCPKSYTKEFKNFDLPLLVIAGRGDKVAPPEDAFQIKKLIKSKEVETMELSKENFSADYGHLDLIIGFNSSQEVFPIVYNWLEEHS